ncbi:MAG TPA: ankyrin repeat domain-containing protein [Bryobacteraceae bacterium]|nr:ankyrin repeat domain-containing protein [Bryobacteraceae bacterium]
MRMRFFCATLALAAMTGFAAPGTDLRLVEAARNQDAASVRSLLKQHLDVNAGDVDGTTALIYAAHQNDLDLAKALLAAGANAKVANRYGVTALSEACNVANGELIELLLKAGSDPNATIGEGETPLMTASRTGSIAGVKALLAAGADAKAKESYRGETALMWAVAENHTDVARLLIAADADVNARSTFYDFKFRKVASGGTQAIYFRGGLTPLLFAARQGAVESAQLLIEAGADVNMAEPEFNFTPLLEAIYNDHYDLAALLVDKKANPDGALYLAVEMRNLDYFGNRPRKAVTDKIDELGFIKFLLDHGSDPNALLKTKLPGRMAQGAIAVPPGATPFYRAARSADLAVMRLLLEKGADPNRPSNDHTTPLLAAATGQGARFAGGEERPIPEFVEALRLCVEKGADVNTANDRGDTPMHAAAERGANPIVQFLADHGARPDVKNKSGRTPLDVAMGIGGVANTGGSVHTDTAESIRKLMDRAATQKVAQVQ